MESYLCDIKDVVDPLAAINSPLTNQEVIQCIVDGLDDDSETFIIIATYFVVTSPLMIFIQN